jgi:type III pantothenate kinase
MILCLDIGNSYIFGGVFEGNKPRLTFRKVSKTGASSDEYGLFFRGVVRENGIDPDVIQNIAICSVVPEMLYTVSASCQKYFGMEPFILRAGTRTGLKILYRNPLEVGSDRIANAIAATQMYPDENLVLIDLGTATTLCAVGKDRSYMGGVIMPGLRMSMEALDRGASKLGSVEIVRSTESLGRTTASSIQIGLFQGHYGALRAILEGIISEHFPDERPKVLATGGFANLFDESGLFDEVVPDLVLRGLLSALQMNQEK